MWLIVGLGNPGAQYSDTRHNVGFMVIDRLSEQFDIPLRSKSMKALWGKGLWEGRGVVLSKPQAFMNLSGESVVRLANHFFVEDAQIIVIHDDLDLDLGRIKILEKGSDAGHKGIRSIIDHLKRENFIRLRLGIGRKQGKRGSEKEYVLTAFGAEEQRVIADQIERAGEAVRMIIIDGPAVAMNQFNRRVASPVEK